MYKDARPLLLVWVHRGRIEGACISYVYDYDGIGKSAVCGHKNAQGHTQRWLWRRPHFVTA